ncbi:hypothetical protein LMH87_000699 [Akanthomyces muscarius]|uniref:Cell wall galactomannoprotein n=2 Tax=Akanthomyces TaxID=150366 RepID=A0A168C1E8_CORDF|nr:hypothetical protein LMH87_000699 [Akanthomyces muscarius]KAJ4155458.1 hypothetical protein LMH87_000699 [Akanthomyces muscarius]OAA70813.1 Cell wall galactomannoprotein [Akanthomyces lecanii RCEF 1005]
MHFSAPLVLITAVTGAHAFVVQRDAKPILDVFAKVQTDIDGLDSAVKAWTADPAPVLDASNKLVATIGQGATTVQGTSELTLNEAIGLLGPVKDLKGHAQTLVDDLKGKKDVVQKGGLCEAVSSQVTDISGKSKALIDATVSKVPAGAQNIAKQQAQGFLDILQDAQTAFSADNCKNA